MHMHHTRCILFICALDMLSAPGLNASALSPYFSEYYLRWNNQLVCILSLEQKLFLSNILRALLVRTAEDLEP